jgi:hypothetical protein
MASNLYEHFSRKDIIWPIGEWEDSQYCELSGNENQKYSEAGGVQW